VVRKLRQGGSAVELVNLNPESLNLFRRISDSPDALGPAASSADELHAGVEA